MSYEKNDEWGKLECLEVVGFDMREGAAQELRKLVGEYDDALGELCEPPCFEEEHDVGVIDVTWESESISATWTLRPRGEEILKRCGGARAVLDRLETIGWASSANYPIGYHDGARKLFCELVRPILNYYVENQSPRTPREADMLTSYFCERFDSWLLESVRESWRPRITWLLNSARTSATPTSTGIDRLDAVLGGGIVPGVSVLAGDPSTGKTAMACQTMLHSAHECGEGERVAYVMLDQGGRAEIGKRLVSLSAAIDADMRGEDAAGCELSRAWAWTDEERKRGVDAYRRLSHERAILGDSSDLRELLAFLEEVSVECVTSWRLVVVDSIQLVRDGETGATVATDPTFAVQAMSRLRTWAYESKTPILVTSEFTKESSDRHQAGKEPRLTDVLGSAEVAYGCESVLALSNDHDGAGGMCVMDLKHRHAGNVAQGERRARLLLDGEHGYFRETFRETE